MTYVAGPFDAIHAYLQWGGSLPGSEQWSCGMRLAWVGSGSPSMTSADLTAMETAVQNFHTAGGASISPRAKLTEVKMNLIGTDGRYINPTTNVVYPANIPGGGTDSLTPPNQIAWAVSLLTAVGRGPAHKGRFYVPLPTVPIGTDGEISTSLRDPLKTAATAFLAAVNAVNANWQAAVFSRKSGAAAHRLITTVQVGRVLDTQRRRRRSLAENY